MTHADVTVSNFVQQGQSCN